MRRSFLSLIAVLSAGTIGCKDITAPSLTSYTELAPFANEVMNIQPKYMCPNCGYSNTMKFYAPIGVDPILDFSIKNITADSPVVVVKLDRVPDPYNTCSMNTCTRTPWVVYLQVTAEKVGEVEVTVFLKTNPDNKSTVRVVSSEYYGGKGD